MPLNAIVISLTEARRRPLMEQLALLPTFVCHLQPGVRGSEIWEDESIIDSKSFEYINDRPMTSGEAGAAYSHFLVYKSIVENNWPWALVLEDNARLLDGADNYLNSLISAIDSNPSHSDTPILVHLNHENAKFISCRISVSTDIDAYQPFTILRTSKAYLINFSAAQIAVNDGLPLKDLTDWPHWIHGIKFLVSIQDWVVVDRSGGSEIGIRPKARRDRKMHIWQKGYRKFSTFFKFVVGLEALSYRKNTGLNDYFAWIVMDRFFRLCEKLMGKPDTDNSTVVILDYSQLRVIKEHISKKQLMKKTSKFAG
jgi:hypothetical protein